MDIFTYLQSGPQKYAIILCVAWVIIIIPVMIILFKKRKRKAEAFLQRDGGVAVVNILTKAKKEELASAITVKKVNEKSPVFAGMSGKQFYVQPGVNKIQLKAEWTEFSLLARGNKKFISTDAIIEIIAQVNETYNLKYNIKDQQFVVEKL